MRYWFVGVIAAFAIALVACDAREVTRDQYGTAWPLTVDSAALHCENDAVWATIRGRDYALNGWAQTYKSLPELPRSLWRNDPRVPGLKVSIGPLIRDGLALC